jgi:hypothetical protein
MSYTLGRRLTTYATYDRPHLRPQKKKNKLINKLIINQEVTTEDTHNQYE